MIELVRGDIVKADAEALRKAETDHREALAAILTPQQQAKFVLSMGHGRGGMHHGKWGKGKACKPGKDGDKGPKGHGDEPEEK